MKKKILWKILLVVGFLPFLTAIFSGVYAAFNGFSGLAILGPVNYGWQAFADWIVLFSYIYWPTYVVGLILIVVAGRKLWK